ncbi:hypothetical protein ACJX0J_032838, partial [Zea mays]
AECVLSVAHVTLSPLGIAHGIGSIVAPPIDNVVVVEDASIPGSSLIIMGGSSNLVNDTLFSIR